MIVADDIDAMNIVLYSVRGFTGSALKQKLEKELEVRRLVFPVIEVNQVDKFIKAGLTTVPAFKMGQKVISHPHNGNVDATVKEVMDYILTESKKTILVPIDFTEESIRAIDYAKSIASKGGFDITLVHVHQSLYDPVSAGALDVHLWNDLHTYLQGLIEKLNNQYEEEKLDVRVHALMEEGETAHTLIHLLGQDPYTLMVMATKSMDNVLRRIFGTVSSEVSRHSQKPVIVVPSRADNTFPAKLVIGISEEIFHKGILTQILEFGSLNNAFFDFVHVSQDNERFEVLRQHLYQHLVFHKELLSGYNIVHLHQAEEGTHKALAEYADSARAGMIVLVTHQRNFLEELRHTSVVKRMLHQPDVPVMILHSHRDL